MCRFTQLSVKNCLVKVNVNNITFVSHSNKKDSSGLALSLPVSESKYVCKY